MAKALIPDEIRKFSRSDNKNLSKTLDNFDEPVPQTWRACCEKAFAIWADLFIERTASGKKLTLIHADTHIINILIPRSWEAHRPVIFDWEGCTRGIGLYDLAYMLIQVCFSPQQRRDLETKLLRRYYIGLMSHGVQDYTWEDCLYDYRLCIIANLRPTMDWKNIRDLRSAMDAFDDWDCAELIQ